MTMRRRGRMLLGGLVLLAVPVSPLGAQLPSAIRLEDVGFFAFDEREGLPQSVIYDVLRAANGTLWIASGSGAFRFAGDRWVRDARSDALEYPQIRSLAETSDSSLWFGGRTAVYRVTRGVTRMYGARDGIPAGAVVYSMVVSNAITGTPTILLGSGSGLFRLDSTDRFVAVPLPAGFDPAGLMLARAATRGGRESLWLASIETGVARYADGTWTVWGAREGLNPVVEAVAAGAPDDSVEALAATGAGAFALVRGQWRSVSTPGIPINRAVRVRSAGRYETWLGTFAGQVLRETGVQRWDTLTSRDRWATSPVVALRAIDDGVGDATVYAGYRGGGLARLRTGRAARVWNDTIPLRRLITLVSELAEPDGRRSLAVFRSGRGMQRTPRAEPDPFAEPVNVFGPLVRSIADTRPFGGDLWLGTTSGLFRLQGGRWVRAPSPEGDSPSALVSVGPVPGGRKGALLATPAEPLRFADARGWHPFPGAPTGRGAFLATDTVDDAPTLWMHTSDALYRYDGAKGDWSRVPGLSGHMARFLTGARSGRLASGERVLWVSSSVHGVGRLQLDAPDTVWRWIAANRNRAMRSSNVSSIAIDGEGHVYAGTAGGLLMLVPGHTISDSVVIGDVFVASDGLPHEHITALALSLDQRRLWVGTLEGLGAVELRHAESGGAREPKLTFDVHLASAESILVAPNSTVPWRERSIHLDFWLDTRHRESATRYRLEVDGAPALRDTWSRERTISLPSLGTGIHVVRLWAMDWRGKVTGPAQFTFRVAPPIWRRAPAIGGYVVALAALLLLGDRWRQAKLRRRAAALEASERRISASELRFRRLFEDAADAQLLVRHDRVVDANPAAITLLGAASREALLELPLTSIVPQTLPVFGGVREGEGGAGEGSALIEATAHALNGEEIPVAARRIAIDVPSDPFEYVELRDLRAERKQDEERATLEHQLREAQRLESLGNLAGGVAHDFNNILTIIQGHAQLLRATFGSAPGAADSVTSILAASERARGIVQQILTFSRRSAPRRVIVPLGNLVRETAAMLRASIPSTVQLVIDDRSAGANMLGDPTELHQLLMNLAANAEYALRPKQGGTLTIALEEVVAPRAAGGSPRWPMGRALRLEVRDTGTGMSPEVQAHIFEPFFTTKPVGEGTGLGLSVLHGIVTSHGGTVEVSSVADQGTAFIIHFPLAAAGDDEGSASAATTPARVTAPARESILVVDDEVAVARVTSLLLESAGYRVRSCLSPGEAVSAIAEGAAVDLVITDQTMPGMTGLALAHRLHAMRPSLPIIIATGYSQLLLPDDLERAGVRRVLEKPFMEEDLLRGVKETLETSHVGAPRDGTRGIGTSRN